MTKRGRLVGWLVFGAVLGAFDYGLPVGRAAEKSGGLAIGDKVPNGSALRDRRGNRRPLQSFSGNKAVVLAFLGTDCPLSNLYLPGLIELEKKLRPQKVQFVAVYPNENEDLDKVSMHAYDRDVPFPVLKDFGQKLAGALGVERVPEVVVLDGDFTLRYRGRIDDRYGAAFRRPKATRDDLTQAIEEVVAGKPVSVAETEADGCLINRGPKNSGRNGVTYSKQVSRILQDRCQNCHRPDQAAPFSLLTFEDAAGHGRMIKEVTSQRRMPPWHADPRYGHFVNNRRMTDDEVETVTAWVDAGMPRGNDKDLPKPVTFPEGWSMGQPDQIFALPQESEIPADGVLPYKHVMVPTNFTEDRWIQKAEARPGARSVVHHIIVYITPEGQKPFAGGDARGMSVLVGWAPGDLGLICPPDTALRIPKGATLLFEVHYTPNGTPAKDRSAVGVTFAKGPPKFELRHDTFANESITVPAHDPHYRAEATLRFRADARLLSCGPHMHWRGKDFNYEIIYPDGKKETILSVPRWDFNWQNLYNFQEPIKLPKGSRLHAVAHWDNSKNNPYNPDPNKAVSWGLQTWDEMMVGWVQYVWERPETAAELAKVPLNQVDLIFDRFDRNGDDVITPDEIPARAKPLLFANGIKIPEKMNREEFAVFFEKMRKVMPQRRPNLPSDAAKKQEEKPKSQK